MKTTRSSRRRATTTPTVEEEEEGKNVFCWSSIDTQWPKHVPIVLTGRRAHVTRSERNALEWQKKMKSEIFRFSYELICIRTVRTHRVHMTVPVVAPSSAAAAAPVPRQEIHFLIREKTHIHTTTKSTTFTTPDRNNKSMRFCQLILFDSRRVVGYAVGFFCLLSAASPPSSLKANWSLVFGSLISAFIFFSVCFSFGQFLLWNSTWFFPLVAKRSCGCLSQNWFPIRFCS